MNSQSTARPGHRRFSRACRLAGAALLLAGLLPTVRPDVAPARARATDERLLNIESFEHVWRTIRDKHWDPRLGGLDWQAVHDELRPGVEKAASRAEARAIIREMISRLGQSHFGVFSFDVHESLTADGASDIGDIPSGAGEPGLDVRVIRGNALVTSIERDAPAHREGIRTGWQILSINGKDLQPVIRRVQSAYEGSTLLDLRLRRAMFHRMTGAIGSRADLVLLDGAGRTIRKAVPLHRPRGTPSPIGHLPADPVWIEHHWIQDGTGYITFNQFRNPMILMPEFEKAVRAFMGARGIIIDLRGNPGGLGAMSLGMAGWFISEPDQRLGTMHTREFPAKFVVNPRPQSYAGPLAILVDGCSASTSEILAGGLQALGRARVFGTRTAGAALPSAFEKLPNGDVFQYAFANYISEDGRSLEGNGVVPDVRVELSRETLLEGRDAVLDAAAAWIGAHNRTRTPEEKP